MALVAVRRARLVIVAGYGGVAVGLRFSDRERGVVMNRAEVSLAVIRGLVKRPRLGNAVFRFDVWGNILGPDRFVDPYPVLERMRAPGPVSFSPLMQQWAVVGYDEARQVLTSPSFGVAGQMDFLLTARPYSRLAESTATLLRNALLFTDPPRHTRLRAAVSRAFTPRQMKRLEPRIRTLVDQRVAELLASTAPDVMATVAAPLPIQVIAELIGVPEDRWEWMTATSAFLVQILDPFTVVDIAAIDRTVAEMSAYYGALADERRAAPSEDLITVLAQAEAEGQIDRNELVSLVTILLFAGHETTTGAIGNAVVALARHPEQRAMLQAQPALWPNAIEEFLRYDTVLQTDPRVALEDVEIAGRRIKAGQNLTIMMGAVNRDPRRFDAPEQLRVDRVDPSPLSFGHGLHHCIGATLARLELGIVLPALVNALGDYTVESVGWRKSLAFRSPTILRVVPGRR